MFQIGRQTPKIEQAIRQGTQHSEVTAGVAAVTVIRVGKEKTDVLILQIGAQSCPVLLVATIVIITPGARRIARLCPKCGASGNQGSGMFVN